MAGEEVVVVFVFLILFILIIVLSVYSSNRKKEFSDQAEKMIKRLFPYMEVKIISEGSAFDNPEIEAKAVGEGYVRYLFIRFHTVSSGKHSHTYLIVKAEIQAEPYISPLYCMIRKEGFFNKFFRGENYEIGDPLIDDYLLINVQPYANADFFFSSHNILQELNNKYDLNTCEIKSELDSSISINFKNNTADIASLNSTFSAIRSLIPYSKRKDKYPVTVEPRIEEESIFVTSPVETKSKTKTEPKTTIQQILQKFESRVNSLNISKNSAEMILEIGLFRNISWKWDEKTISIRAVGTVKNGVKLEVHLRPKSHQIGAESSWFKPYQNLDLEVFPKLLADEVENAYDIAMNFNLIKSKNIYPQLDFLAEDNDAEIQLIAEAIPENVRQIFELLTLFSWEWITNFILY